MLFKKILCFFIFAVIAGLFTACDSAGTDYPYGPVSQGNIEALVLNEGGINQNMGGISVLNKDGSVIPDIFREVNHRPLGDVAQSYPIWRDNWCVSGLWNLMANLWNISPYRDRSNIW